MDVNKRLENMEKQMEEINDKLDVLLSVEGIAGFAQIRVNIGVPIKKDKRLPIPKKVDLTELEKKIVRLIYESGRDGISLRGISNNLQIGTKECKDIINNIMRKRVPIESTKGINIFYRFEQRVMEAQAKKDFLQLTKR